MSCEIAQKLIEKALDGTINQTELTDLRVHAETCGACSDELRRLSLLEEVIRDALSPQGAVQQARTEILDRIFVQTSSLAQGRTSGDRLSWVRIAVAATVLLAAGLVLGLALGRTGSGSQAPASKLVQVPMHVGDLNGTVLVRHDGSDTWRPVQAGDRVCLGDTFHATAKSHLVLELQDKSTIQVNPNSMLALTSYDPEIQFFLDQGECTASLESPHGSFFISTPHGRVEAMGTEFTVTVE